MTTKLLLGDTFHSGCIHESAIGNYALFFQEFFERNLPQVNEEGILVYKHEKINIEQPVAPQSSNLGQLTHTFGLSEKEEMLIAFFYLAKTDPQLFSPFTLIFDQLDVRFTFGGQLEGDRHFYIPTLYTFVSLFFPSEDKHKALSFLSSNNHILIKKEVILFNKNNLDNGNRYDAEITVSDNYQTFLLGGNFPSPDQNHDFPANRSNSSIPYEDIVLSENTRNELVHFERILKVYPKLSKNSPIYKKIRKSHVVVFTGAPGTGKSLTATTLGNLYNIPTYTLDISRVVSKYIGEFEKSMEKIFSQLEGFPSILFIDEADSIFSKRSDNVKDSKDKYANQEMSYLLQRIESFEGIIILASNVRDIRYNMDQAMLRRISQIIEFSYPSEKERKELWLKALVDGYQYENELLTVLARDYQLTGANIKNIISEVYIDCILEDEFSITFDMLKPYIEREFYKKDAPMGVCTDQMPGPTLLAHRLGRLAMHTGKRM
ncbi:ATP-binding protein [Flammeovirga sp. SJP92]|uniref:ATP-binding protein n=1 Tax=Flammeovirga sp. SJP92 TaxID=1775430 RepID=UPI000788A187|nr:ATP-binding protein [Flammeovirga sp. SJP92]KXX67506.1 hypothetical protein AVL50_25915 [Flammeovirga sp. SJP92]